MSQKHRETFITIKTEGALLPVEILQRIAEGDRHLDGLSPESYHLAKNEKLNEAINRAWNRCDGAWRSFQAAADILPETDAGTTLTRERWLLILFQELGYGRLLTSKAQQIDGKAYPISHAWHHSPIHLISSRQDLDRRAPGVAGAARMSPHSMVQEFLNRSDDHLWGIVSNGLRLRLLRDNFSLTRQAYVEFDLQAMMSGEVYSDFILLYMILHQSRVEAEKPEQCWLERWTEEAQRRGTRALDQLRKGVQQAIQTLGQGFLAHPANSTLRQKLQSGVSTPHGLYEQLLRLVYRLIFLFVAEDRDLLLGTHTPPEARSRYMDHYSLTRIRRIAGRLRGARHGDLWQGLRVTFRCLIDGQPALGLSPLGGFLFSEDALTDLNDCDLSNDALLTAVRHLSFTRDRRMLRPVDYRNLGTEELGSVYESLLELHPEVNVGASTFELKVAAGSERKTTGSYYTPSSLIRCLLDSALEPVIARKLKEPDPEKALLDLKVVDPACGSGHFLIAAAHRIGKHLAIIRTGEIEPPPEERRKALRDVVSHCIYGVDVNPLAVELCKVALWIETLDPGRPLGFLDHHIKCGNSLIGATPELLEKGIPDDAFKPVEGDDKKIASGIRKKNKREQRGERDLFAGVTAAPDWQEAVEGFQAWGSMPENAFHQVCEKATQYGTLRENPAYRHQKQTADLWVSAFFWPLTEESAASVPTEDVFRRFQQGTHHLKEEEQRQTERLVAKHRFFHWYLEFPDVFSHEGYGGFSCVLGNPPWEKIKLQEKEFFAQKDPEIANARTASARRKLIAKLPESNPSLAIEFAIAFHQSECESKFLRASGRFPFNSGGDINIYAVFTELSRALLNSGGYAGIVVPSGIVTDFTYREFFGDLLAGDSLNSFYGFENQYGIFPGIHREFKFGLMTMRNRLQSRQKGSTELAFFIHALDELAQPERRFRLTADDFSKINPNTKTCPVFRTRRDAELTKRIYQRLPVLMNELTNENPWELRFFTMFHMTNDSHLFCTPEALQECGFTVKGVHFVGKDDVYLPLYEGRTIWVYDHRACSIGESEKAVFRSATSQQTSEENHANAHYCAMPRYWVPGKAVEERIENYDYRWFVGFRDVTTPTAEHTMVCTVIPRTAAGNKVPLILSRREAKQVCCLVSNFCAFVFDYVTRNKLNYIGLNFYIVKQLPTLPPNRYTPDMLNFVVPRVLELVYTAWDVKSFADDIWQESEHTLKAEITRHWKANVKVTGGHVDAEAPPWVESASQGVPYPPFKWDDERRVKIRCDLDAFYFHLYGINRDDVDYIMETFPIVRRKDEQKYGEYRTKRVILECYDAMAESMKTGKPYQTILDPPPADPRVAHESQQEVAPESRGNY